MPLENMVYSSNTLAVASRALIWCRTSCSSRTNRVGDKWSWCFEKSSCLSVPVSSLWCKGNRVLWVFSTHLIYSCLTLFAPDIFQGSSVYSFCPFYSRNTPKRDYADPRCPVVCCISVRPRSRQCLFPVGRQTASTTACQIGHWSMYWNCNTICRAAN